MSQPVRRAPRAPRIAASLTLAVGAALLAPLPAAAFEPIDEYTTISGWAAITVTADGTKAYLANRNDDSVTVVDLIDFSTITTFGVGDAPLGAILSPDETAGVVTSYSTNEIQFFNPETNTTVGTPVVTGYYPFDAAFTSNGTKVWIATYGGSITIVDVATRTVDATIPGFVHPYDIQLSPDGTVFWVVDSDGMLYAVDAATQGVLDSIAITNLPTSIQVTPDGTRAYVANKTTEIVELDTSDPTDLAVIDTITTPETAMHVALSPDGTTLYANLVDDGGADDGVTRIDLATGTQDFVAYPGDVYRIALMPNGNGLLVSQYSTDLELVADPVIRLAGANRYATGVEISQEGFPGGADVVYVSSGLSFPDALAAGPAAAHLNGPVLLTDPVNMPADVRAEIVRLAPERITVVGGPDRVSAAIVTDLNSIAPTDRISGANRFETSREIALDAFDTAANSGGAEDVYIATGLNFPDALAAGAAGASFGAPVILVNGTQPTVDQATLDTLTALGAVNIYVVGGSNMVSDGIVTQLGATRISGADRFQTALAINQDAFASTDARRAIIATGLAFPDALAASALAGQIQAPLFLAPTNCVPAGVLTELTALGVTQVTLVGGPDRLTQSVFDLTSC